MFLTSGLGAMGYGLPAAIGACLGNGRQPMLAVESDGSLQLNLQDLATLVNQKLPICLLVMNNAGYASIRNTQRQLFEGRYLASGPSSGLTMPSLEKIADTYGLGFMRIIDCTNLADALVRAQLTLPRPCLIEIGLISDESLQPKCAAIPRPDGSIVSMPLEDIVRSCLCHNYKQCLYRWTLLLSWPASMAERRPRCRVCTEPLPVAPRLHYRDMPCAAQAFQTQRQLPVIRAVILNFINAMPAVCCN